MSKRLVDIVVSAACLALLLPCLLAIALAVRLDSPGTVLFRQRRVGRGGQEFVLLKFRTMHPGNSGESCNTFEPGNTARVTRAGSLIRKLKLDELPQLWNVLVGDMSLVGPRPELPQWVAIYPNRWTLVHSVRPGLTDPASLEYLDEESILASAADPVDFYRRVIMPRKLDLYEQYVRNQNLLGDILLVLKTPVVIAVHMLDLRNGGPRHARDCPPRSCRRRLTPPRQI